MYGSRGNVEQGQPSGSWPDGEPPEAEDAEWHQGDLPWEIAPTSVPPVDSARTGAERYPGGATLGVPVVQPPAPVAAAAPSPLPPPATPPAAPDAAPAQPAPAQRAPAQAPPAQPTPAQPTPAQPTPAQDEPTQDEPTQDVPARDEPMQDVPARVGSDGDAEVPAPDPDADTAVIPRRATRTGRHHLSDATGDVVRPRARITAALRAPDRRLAVAAGAAVVLVGLAAVAIYLAVAHPSATRRTAAVPPPSAPAAPAPASATPTADPASPTASPTPSPTPSPSSTSASPTPTQTSRRPSPTPGKPEIIGGDATTAHAGDCVVYVNANELTRATCQPGALEVLRRFDGTTDMGACSGVPGTTNTYYFQRTGGDGSTRLVLCMKQR